MMDNLMRIAEAARIFVKKAHADTDKVHIIIRCADVKTQALLEMQLVKEIRSLPENYKTYLLTRQNQLPATSSYRNVELMGMKITLTTIDESRAGEPVPSRGAGSPGAL